MSYVEPEVDYHPRRKKALDRYCRGNPLLPHEFERRTIYESRLVRVSVLACSRCGKRNYSSRERTLREGLPTQAP